MSVYGLLTLLQSGKTTNNELKQLSKLQIVYREIKISLNLRKNILFYSLTVLGIAVTYNGCVTV